MEHHPNPAKIFEVVNGVTRSMAFKAAVDNDLFTGIAEGSNTAPALATRAKLPERSTRILCDFLVTQEFLTKTGSAYALAPDLAPFLDRHSPAYLASVSEFMLAPMFLEATLHLGEAIKKGGVATEPDGTLSPEHPVWVNFARSMAPLTTISAPKLAALVVAKHPGECRVLDIAASHGLFGIAIAKSHPKAQIVAQDWANVLTVAKENAEKHGVPDRVRMLPGSAFDVDFGGPYEAILVTNFFHHFDKPTCEKLMRKFHAALAPDGHVATLEFVPNADRVTPPVQAAFSLTMLVSTPAGDAYTFDEYDQMFRAAGFRDSELHPLENGMQTILITRK